MKNSNKQLGYKVRDISDGRVGKIVSREHLVTERTKRVAANRIKYDILRKLKEDTEEL